MPQVNFTGLVRPLASLTHITTGPYLSQLTSGQHPGTVKAATDAAKQALVTGWMSYFVFIAVVAVLAASVIGLFVFLLHQASTHSIHKGLGLRTPFIRAALVVAITLGLLIVNVGADYRTSSHMFTDPHLVDRLFSHASVAVPAPVSKKDTTTQIAILGDSTESGEGLPVTAKPNTPDWLCHRSPEAAASNLHASTGLTVTNLACSGATITAGIMGGQVRAGRTVSPQLSALESMPDVKFIFVGVGADDVDWSTIIKACVGLESCDNQATAAAFNQALQQFVQNYYRLLTSLEDITGKLKHKTAVVIDLYYDPFGSIANCRALQTVGWPGLNSAKAAFLDGLLAQLNTTLAQGAQAAGFLTATPNYAGHELCTAEPYVQGFNAKAPFHPNGLGQLAIALADLAALPPNWQTIAAEPQAAPAPSSKQPLAAAVP